MVDRIAVTLLVGFVFYSILSGNFPKYIRIITG